MTRLKDMRHRMYHFQRLIGQQVGRGTNNDIIRMHRMARRTFLDLKEMRSRHIPSSPFDTNYLIRLTDDVSSIIEQLQEYRGKTKMGKAKNADFSEKLDALHSAFQKLEEELNR